jgi:hypothetical protein
MFHRSYDLSCVSDTRERVYIQNAINGVNLACSDSVDAWLYVERGHLLEDMHRSLGDHDHIPKTVFAAMMSDNHSGHSFSFTVSNLQSIAQDYEGWSLAKEQENSRREGSTNFWNSWRSIRLIPYYRSMAGGGSIVSVGPILENFLSLKASRNEQSDESSKIETELMNYLGQDLQRQIDILTDIVSLEDSPHCSQLLIQLKKRLDHKVSMEKRDETLVKDALIQLSSAIESRNPNALRAALNPGWYSVKFQNSELYKSATLLLSELT